MSQGYDIDRTLIGGAVAEGHGVLVGWDGYTEITRSQLSDVYHAAMSEEGVELDPAWLPNVKQAKVQLARALRDVAGTVFDVEGPVRKRDTDPWTARYLMVRRPTGSDARAGQEYGRVVLGAELYEMSGAPLLRFDTASGHGEADPVVAAVRAAFDARTGGEVYTAADVTKWLGGVLKYRLRALRYGGNWYVPRETKKSATVLCETLRRVGWGRHWMVPPLPVADSAELSVGLAIALQADVAEIQAELAYARKVAKDEGKPDISAKQAANYAAKYNAVADDARTRLHLLGPENLKSTLDVVADALIELDSIMEAAAGVP